MTKGTGLTVRISEGCFTMQKQTNYYIDSIPALERRGFIRSERMKKAEENLKIYKNRQLTSFKSGM